MMAVVFPADNVDNPLIWVRLEERRMAATQKAKILLKPSTDAILTVQ